MLCCREEVVPEEGVEAAKFCNDAFEREKKERKKKARCIVTDRYAWVVQTKYMHLKTQMKQKLKREKFKEGDKIRGRNRERVREKERVNSPVHEDVEAVEFLPAAEAPTEGVRRRRRRAGGGGVSNNIADQPSHHSPVPSSK